MDDEDDGAAWHQMELEQRQQEEEAIARGRALMTEQKALNESFERATNEYHQRINQIRSEWYGDHG